MNKETSQLIDYINKSGHYLEKIEGLRDKYVNYKDFCLMINYMVMEIVSEEKKFINMSRKNIDLSLISEKYF